MKDHTPWLSPKTVGRTSWQRGPWDTEPDSEWWELPGGVICWVVRNLGGTLCGYVVVPAGHPWHLLHHACVSADAPAEWSQYAGGRSWFGFDCNHDGHMGPRSSADNHREFARYVTFNEVKRMVGILARALATPPEDRAAAVEVTRRELDRRMCDFTRSEIRPWWAALNTVDGVNPLWQ